MNNRDFLLTLKEIVSELLGLNITIFSDTDVEDLKKIESRFCYNKKIQSLLTVKGLLSFIEARDTQTIYIIRDALDVRFIVFHLKNSWILLGPYLSDEIEDKEPFYDSSSSNLLRGYYLGLPIYSDVYVLKIVSLILSKLTEESDRLIERIDLKADSEDQLNIPVLDKTDEIEDINKRYYFEEEFYQAVLSGNAEEALKVYSELVHETKNLHFITKSLRDEIAGGMAMRVLVRRAAIKSGLTPLVVDTLSQAYAQKMHNARSEKEIHRLIDEYIRDFCDLIKRYSKLKYSSYIKRALQYIEIHLNEEIDSKILATFCGLSHKYFQKLFRKELGVSVQEYITQARCQKAATLLEDTRLPIREISYMVGYSDANYFSRIFRKVMNCSPREYRIQKQM